MSQEELNSIVRVTCFGADKLEYFRLWRHADSENGRKLYVGIGRDGFTKKIKENLNQDIKNGTMHHPESVLIVTKDNEKKEEKEEKEEKSKNNNDPLSFIFIEDECGAVSSTQIRKSMTKLLECLHDENIDKNGKHNSQSEFKQETKGQLAETCMKYICDIFSEGDAKASSFYINNDYFANEQNKRDAMKSNTGSGSGNTSGSAKCCCYIL